MASKRVLKLELIDYIKFVVPIYLLEFLAALAGTIYLRKGKTTHQSTKYFVWFLWYTLFSELFSNYGVIASFTEFEYFSFIEGTVFQRTKWVYNIFTLVSSVFLTVYFSMYVKSVLWKKFVKILCLLFVVSSVFHFCFTDVFFKEDSKYVNLVGTFLVFMSVVVFYFEILRTDVLLNLKRYLPVYISIGVLVFYLCMTPLSIFSEYFNKKNITFVELQSHLVLYSNLFMYSFFILGFYICSKTKKSF